MARLDEHKAPPWLSGYSSYLVSIAMLSARPEGRTELGTKETFEMSYD